MADRNRKKNINRQKHGFMGFKKSIDSIEINYKDLELKALKLCQDNELEKAELIYRELILNSNLARLEIYYCNLAAISVRLGKLKEGIELLESALKLNPNYFLAQKNLAYALKNNGNLEESIEAFKKAFLLNKKDIEILYDLALIFQRKSNHERSLEYFYQVIQINPEHSEALNNIGVILQKNGNTNDSENYYLRSLKANPNNPDATNNLAILKKDNGELQSAIYFYKKALKLKPKDADIATNYAYSLLLNNDYTNGLIYYEKRHSGTNSRMNPIAKPISQKYNKENLTKDEKVLIVSEQGLGDTIQFMRYIKYLNNEGYQISFCAQDKLHGLIISSGIDFHPISPKDAKLIDNQKWIPLLSIPKFLHVSNTNPIVNKPYIFTPEHLITKWSRLIRTNSKSIIGINWQGNPDTEIINHSGRSLPLETFSLITDNKNIKFLSLQKGYGTEQLENCSFKNKFVNCQEEINKTWCFVESAAIIANCDLVITSDTSVAHLAGGMGKPTWLLLKYIPDWRWGINGNTSFWYQSMRVFRQQEKNNWHDVMVIVHEEINKLFS